MKVYSPHSLKRSSFCGFTLIELLVVSVILTLLSIIIVQIFMTTMRTNSKTEIIRDVKGSGDRAIEMMSRLVQNAQSIQLPESVTCPEGSPSEALDDITLIQADGGETTLTCVEDVIDGVTVARIASASASQTVYLTSTNVTVFDPVDETNACTNHALSFTCSSVGTLRSYITIGFTLHQADRAASKTDTSEGSFQTTVTIRNKE